MRPTGSTFLPPPAALEILCRRAAVRLGSSRSLSEDHAYISKKYFHRILITTILVEFRKKYLHGVRLPIIIT